METATLKAMEKLFRHPVYYGIVILVVMPLLGFFIALRHWDAVLVMAVTQVPYVVGLIWRIHGYQQNEKE